MKKYELTSETKWERGVTLHRIRALVDIKRYGVKAGDLGGWVEKESNLSHENDAWVGGNARAAGNALVVENAWVGGNTWVDENACVTGNARVTENAVVFGAAFVAQNARVTGNAHVTGNAWVDENAWVGGDARVTGNTHVTENACVSKTDHVLAVGPIGSRGGTTTFFRGKFSDGFAISVCCGCFRGTVAEFRVKVKQTHGDSKHGKAYQLAADLAETQIELDEEEL